MTVLYNQAVPVASPAEQAHYYYQWLTFCCQFALVESSGTWTTTKSGSDGRIDTTAPTHFLTDSAVFVNAAAPAGDVGRYLAVRDTTNPENTVIAQITAVVNSFDVILSSSAVFTTDATSVEYVVFDPQNVPPSSSDYFVIANDVEGQPQWNAHIQLNAAPTVAWTLGPLGGWDTVTHAWIMPNTSTYYMRTTTSAVFCIADSDAGWIFTWVENSTNRNGLWLGSLSPLHAPNVAGAPTDSYYAAIFGATSAVDVNNIARPTSTADNISVGESMAADTSIIPIYLAQPRLLSDSTDVATLAGTSNPRSSEPDDYDFVAFHRSPNQAWRGKIPGMRLVNDNIANRTAISSGGCYVIENGIGAVWNGAGIVP